MTYQLNLMKPMQNSHLKITLSCRLIEGKYPNYEAVIPKENPNKLDNRKSFATQFCKKSFNVFSNKSTNQIKFKIAGV